MLQDNSIQSDIKIKASKPDIKETLKRKRDRDIKEKKIVN